MKDSFLEMTSLAMLRSHISLNTTRLMILFCLHFGGTEYYLQCHAIYKNILTGHMPNCFQLERVETTSMENGTTKYLDNEIIWEEN